MDTSKPLVQIVLFLGILLLSINFWYLAYVPSKYKKEGFLGLIGEKVPTDTEAALAYRTLLAYMKNNTLNSIKIINDFTTRVYDKSIPVPDSFDPRNILDNFKNPITGM